ncbi:MAG: hypothetical protein ACK5NT_09115 [Pyrinomonadaceae bacterium]
MIDTVKLFNNIIIEKPIHKPLEYYGSLQTLAGIVYEIKNDSHMDNDLKELSKYVQYLSNVDELKNHIGKLVSNDFDCRSMFNAGFDGHNEISHSLKQVTIHFPHSVNFPDRTQIVSENFTNLKTFDFNLPKIISWIKGKINFEEEAQFKS